VKDGAELTPQVRPSGTLQPMSDGTTEETPTSGGTAADLGATSGAKWELLEKIAAVIVVAEAVRLVGSVVSGIVYGASTHTGPRLESQAVLGTTFQTVAGFADGPGVILLLVSLGLAWWRTTHWVERLNRSLAGAGSDGAEPDEAVRLRRLDRLATAVGSMLALAAVAALLFLVGVFLLNTVHGQSAASRAEAFANGTFPLAYTTIATAGFAASRHLAQQCRTALTRV
jgi:hypothetical protein